MIICSRARRRRRRAAFLVCALPALSGTAVAQSRPDTLQGRLVTDSTIALVDAEIIVTRGPDRTVFRARTDADGRWRVIADPGTGDYLVFASAIGRVSQRKRVLRSNAETRFTVDLTLVSAVAQQLARIEIRAAKREAPASSLAGREAVRGSAEADWDGMFSAVAPSDLGNPAALAATVPGLRSTPDGISALGLSGAQTQYTLNGMAGGGAELPRGAFNITRTATTAWDVSRGGFSGAQVDVQLFSGGVYSFKNFALSVEAPSLQATDAVGRALGQRSTLLDLNLSSSGSLDRGDRFGYTAAGRVRRRSAETPSLTSASGAALAASGASHDTVVRLLGTLGELGIPLGTVGGTQRTDVQFASRIERIGYADDRFVDLPRRYGVTSVVNAAWDEGIGLGATATPSATGTGRDITGTVQAYHTLRSGIWLHDTRTSVTVRDARITPLFALPSGSVRAVGSNAASGGIASLVFGGNDRLASDLTRVTWETLQESQVYATSGMRHRIKVFGQLRIDGSAQRARPNSLGAYSYNSLDDLAAGRPASFTRTLIQPDRTGVALNTALGMGSIYRTSAYFALQYGVRLEGNTFFRRPDANPALLQSLGVRTDVSPRDVGVSPRLGFRWVYNKKADNNQIFYYSRAGAFSRQASGVLRGGFGEFRNFVTPENISGAIAATGLPASTLRLLCVGAAIPDADWEAFSGSTSAIPESCANGAPSLADRTPSVRALDPWWRPARSWRSNLNWSQRLLGMEVSFEGVASLNRQQPSTRDANFAGAQRFVLESEGGRPVFVNRSSIVADNGALLTADARRDVSVGSVLLNQSRARSVSTQLRVTATPDLPRRYSLRTSYVLARIRARENGADRNTAADPRVFEWSDGDLDIRHQLQVQGALSFNRVSLSLFSNTLSGSPYTPVVGGDINGDGLAGNDRAFVTRGTAAEPAFQAAMAALLSQTPATARSCLLSSLERIAPRNRCRGPWSSTLNAQLSLDGALFGMSRQGSVSLSMRNLLAGLDQAVNGPNLRGWGTRAFPDPVLYSVRSWDPTTSRFRYDVNPRFGATSARITSVRAPFIVTLDVSMPFGRSYPSQQLNRALRNGRNGFPGPRLDSASLVRRYSQSAPDLYTPILELRDSLFLTPEQTEKLQAAQMTLSAHTNAAWGALAAYLVSLNERYEIQPALSRQSAATAEVWKLMWSDAQALRTLLDPTQLRLLPYPASYLRNITMPPTGF